MNYRSANEIRQSFLDFFKSKGHMIEPGASLIPNNDPTLLWINSGVAALKKYFDGSIKPANNRIANAQKSIRTNDIENVGKTARHHTFFEMLGNFSIGDYFKQEAIEYAWEFLTSKQWMGFDPEKIYITVHPLDEQAFDLWINHIGFDPKRILKSEENYWQIGEGPCGPNTEIYIDRGEAFDPDGVGERLFFEELENDRYIEVWNVVFSQFDGKEGVDRSEYKELPQKNIDTGMGFERLVALVQGGETNFDTDLFMPMITTTESWAKMSYKEFPMAYRVIADHIRTVTFALSDGALFANEGRGYVLRRILRRAVRFGIKIGINEPFMFKLVDVVAENMSAFYPYLQQKVELVSKLVRIEEERFHATLSDGEALLLSTIDKLEGNKLDGATMFKLYDTFGFPVELTVEIAQEHQLDYDMEGFNQHMEQQRQRARNAREDVDSMASQSVDLMNFDQVSEFVGYTKMSCEAKVIACFKAGHRVDQIEDEGEVILDVTPFYATSGGQVADTGVLRFDRGSAVVKDVNKAPRKQHLHSIKMTEGVLREHDHVMASIDVQRRRKIMKNHSSAHLLQSALKEILGSHITQAGSFVSDEYMRFDFTHYEKVTHEQIKQIEHRVNEMIFAGASVSIEHMDVEAAKDAGATALFDEKYEAFVRVITMGEFSKELCGGTHVSNIEQLGLFKIESEESIGSGIRRMVCKTAQGALDSYQSMEHQLEELSTLLKSGNIASVNAKVMQQLDAMSSLKKEYEILKDKVASLKVAQLVSSSKEVAGIHMLISEVEDVDVAKAKQMAENLRSKLGDSVIVLYIKETDKVSFVVASSQKAISAGFKAGDLAKLAATIMNGNGGGRPDLAQSGGKDVAMLPQALRALSEKLGLSL